MAATPNTAARETEAAAQTIPAASVAYPMSLARWAAPRGQYDQADADR